MRKDIVQFLSSDTVQEMRSDGGIQVKRGEED